MFKKKTNKLVSYASYKGRYFGGMEEEGRFKWDDDVSYYYWRNPFMTYSGRLMD